MKVSYEWLQTYFEKKLPNPEEVARLLTFHVFEIDSIDTSKTGDTVYDVKVLPDRACYALSHRGIAKELSAILDEPLKKDPLKELYDISYNSKLLSITIEDSKWCSRYSAMVIRGVKSGPSPEWLQESLAAIGARSINNIVDATNYVMFNLGQPLHAFDAGKLKVKEGNWAINVRKARAGERITTLTGEMRELSPEDLLIVDGNSDEPIGIAGVKGGKSAEVDDATRDLVIESANFHPIATRKTSRRLNLRTDASVRFENRVAPELTSYALRDVAALIQQIAGGEVEGYIDVYPRPRNSYTTGMSVERANSLLGVNLSTKNIEEIFRRHGISNRLVKPIDEVLKLGPTLVGKPYVLGAQISYDAPHKFDCSSLTAYLYAQAGVGIPRMTVDQLIFGTPVTEAELAAGDLVFSNSGNGKIHYESIEFMPGTPVSEGVDHVGLYLGDGKVLHASRYNSDGVIVEPLKESRSFKTIIGMRRMVENEERFVVQVPFERLDLRIEEDLIEEVGRIYGYENVPARHPGKGEKPIEINKRYYWVEKVRKILIDRGFSEVYTSSFAYSGEVKLLKSLASDKQYLRPSLLGNISDSLQMGVYNAELLSLSEVKLFEIGTVFKKNSEHYYLALGKKIGSKSGDVNTDITALTDALKIDVEGHVVTKTEAGSVEIDFGALLEKLPEPEKYEQFLQIPPTRYKPYSLYPFALRDVAFWTPLDTDPALVEKVILESGGTELARVRLFDTFKKDDRVSFAFRLVFQSFERTLTDSEVNGFMENINKKLTAHGYTIR